MFRVVFVREGARLEGYLQMSISIQLVHIGLLSLLRGFICMLNNSPKAPVYFLEQFL